MSGSPNSGALVVDTSAIVAILKDEPEAEQFRQILADAPLALMCSGTWLELMIVVLNAGGDELVRECQELLRELDITPSPLSADGAATALDAYRRYGRGTDHRARLNFGDAFAYALAKVHETDLLYKGDDFAHTDIQAATWRKSA